MESIMTKMLKEDAKEVHLLIAEDDVMMQALYRRLFEAIFGKLTITSNGAEALAYFNDPSSAPVDLIITDNYMPEMGGMELVQKIREKDFSVRIIVMTSEEDLNTMRDYLQNGVDAILPKPYNEALTAKVLQRVLHHLSEKKMLEHYIQQLELMAKESVAMKSEQRKERGEQQRTPKLQKSDSVKEASAQSVKQEETLVQKYDIRASVKDMEYIDAEQLDIIGTERIDSFREKIADYEFALCSIEGNSILQLREVLKDVLEGIRELISALNVIGIFPVAANAAVNLVHFVENLSDESLQNGEKRELFIDILVHMLEDFDKWINMVFISQNTDNIHYFDASFANTCLELEMVFQSGGNGKSEDDVLEFF